MNCKFCYIEISDSKRRVVQACRKCRHKHYTPAHPETWQVVKHCSRCEASLPFSRKPNQTGICRPCWSKEYYSRPEIKEAASNRSKTWAKANRERRSLQMLKWQRANPDRAKEIYNKTIRGIKNRTTRGKHQANRRGLEWAITENELQKLREQPCHYCAAPLHETGHGLDRKDNAKGYTAGNVVPCCATCNKVKGPHLTYDEMCVAMDAILRLRRIQRFGSVINA